jgi:radical SAM protein with 4Fe4S-binding SPASM domain
MIDYAKQHRIKVIISSNLNIFSEKWAEMLIDSGLDTLIVSLDGTSQESYGKYRIGGDFNKVIDNTKLLIEKKREKGSTFPHIQIQFVILKHNQAEIPKVRELVKSLGVDIFFRQGILGGKGQSPPLIKDTALAKKWLSPNKEYRMEYDYFSDKPYIKENGPCVYLWKVATINWDGSVFPCCWVFEPKDSFGDIWEQSFKTIWNNELFQSARSLFSRREKTFLKSRGKKQETICHRCKMYNHIFNDQS